MEKVREELPKLRGDGTVLPDGLYRDDTGRARGEDHRQALGIRFHPTDCLAVRWVKGRKVPALLLELPDLRLEERLRGPVAFFELLASPLANAAKAS